MIDELSRRMALLAPLGFGFAAGLGVRPGIAAGIDFSDRRQLIDAYVRVVGDTSGETLLSFAHSRVFAQTGTEQSRHLFDLLVLGAARFRQVETGWLRIQREIAYYADPVTGEILERWSNPWLNRDVAVIHIQNDPVNRRFDYAEAGPTSTIHVEIYGDDVMWSRPVVRRFDNPLKRAAYPLHSTGDTYEAAELISHFCRLSELADLSNGNVRAPQSWARVGPFLPWMEMGDRPGRLVYTGQAAKLSGPEQVPAKVRALTEARFPQYLEAPTDWTDANESSWSFFKRVIDARSANPKGE